MTDALVLGADIGGSHITTALIDLDNKQLFPGSYQRVRVNASETAGAIVERWSGVIQQTLRASGALHPIGIAMPGPFDYAAGISQIKGQAKYEQLYGINVKHLLADRLQIGADRIRMANDAACFLQGELFSGAVAGKAEAMGFTLGTGLGSAVAHLGVAADAELWSVPFLDSQAEDYFSSRWFVGQYNARSGGAVVENVKQIALLAGESEVARALFAEFGSNLALFLAKLGVGDGPVVLGGNIAQTYGLFCQALNDGLRKLGVHVNIILSELGEDAALFGAASLWRN